MIDHSAYLKTLFRFAKTLPDFLALYEITRPDTMGLPPIGSYEAEADDPASHP